MRLKTGKFLLLGFLLCLSTASNAFSAVNFSDVYKDSMEKLWPTAILKVADEKLDERVFYNPEYRNFTGREITNNFWFTHRPSPNFRYDTNTERVMAQLVKEDITGALEYGLVSQVRKSEAYNRVKRWGKGLSAFRIDKSSETGNLVIETPSYNRELDPYEEAKSNLRFECGNIKGDAAITFAKRLRCSEATNEVAIRESQIFSYRLKPGIDADIQTTNSYSITPVLRPYLNLKYNAYEAELSYVYPIRLVGNVYDKASFIPDIRDKIFYKRESAERIQLEIDKTFNKHFVMSGNYRFERTTGNNNIGIAPRLFFSPYIASAGGDVNVRTMKPLLTVDMGRVLGGYVLGIRGTATKHEGRNDWDYQGLFTISKVWTDSKAHLEKSESGEPYPYETSFFEDLGGIFHSLF